MESLPKSFAESISKSLATKECGQKSVKEHAKENVKENYIKNYSLKRLTSKKNLKLENNFKKDNYSYAKKQQINEQVFQHKKSLGQNFLHDSIIIDKIIQSIPSDIAKLDSVQFIEVGIGLGDLTKKLLSKYKLLAYEIDSNLISRAKKNYAKEISENRLQLVQANVLKVQHGGGYLLDSDYFLVSNLPYYIATAIILRALKDGHCKGFLVMTQKEVAQKFCAQTKDSKYCALSVLAQSFGNVEYLFEVPKEAFVPEPKVQSAVFCFQRNECNYTQDLESLLHAAFSTPRKKLLSNLTKWDKIRDNAMLINIFQNMGLSHDIRAHEISLQEYCKILHVYNVVKKDK